jgi:hypothetical protein
MPGTPPTSPRFGFPRPSDADTAEFSVQVLAIADVLDARAAKTWNYLAKSSAYTAAEGDFVYAAAGVTVTLPTPTAGVAVAVQGDGTVTGASPATVSGGSADIKGGGLSGSTTSFVLGTPGATAVLVADGTNWHFVSGQQDSGWVALTLSSNWNAYAGAYAPAYKQVGSRVELSGACTNNTGSVSSSPFATFPAGIRPASAAYDNFAEIGGGSFAFSLTTGGTATVQGVTNGASFSLENRSYRLS